MRKSQKYIIKQFFQTKNINATIKKNTLELAFAGNSPKYVQMYCIKSVISQYPVCLSVCGGLRTNQGGLVQEEGCAGRGGGADRHPRHRRPGGT